MADQKKTVLFFPLNSPGHINSTLGIADRLKQDHGFRTVFLLLGPMVGNSIREHGHELIILEEAEPHEDYEISEDEEPTVPVDEELMKKKGKTKKQFLGVYKWPQLLFRYQKFFRLDPVETFVQTAHTMEKLMVEELIANHDNYARAIESVSPDIVVIDAYYIPPCIITMKNTPWVRLYSANPLMEIKSKLPGGVRPPPMVGCKLFNKSERARLREEEPEKWQSIMNQWKDVNDKIVETVAKSGDLLKPFLIEKGCSPLEPGQQARDSPHLNIYMFPEALDYDQDDDIFEYRPRWFRCDSLMRKPTNEAYSVEVKHWEEKINEASKGKSAIVFFSLGSIASGDVKLMKRFAEMFEDDAGRLYIMSKGMNGDRYQLKASNTIGGNYVPQTYCLQRSDLAIVHGGNNSISECMYYGLPMIVLPVFADQLDNAQRVEDLGFGRRLDVHTCTKEQLRQAIDDLLNDKPLIEKMRQIGKRMQSRDEVGKVSLVLKKLAEEKHLEQEFVDKCQVTTSGEQIQE